MPISLLISAGSRSFCLLFLFVCAGCSTLSTVPHPLDGKIVNTIEKTVIDESDIDKLIASADVVYLGEVHDNPWHHELQTKTLEKLVLSGASPALGLEMFSNSQTGDLMGFVNSYSLEKKSAALTTKQERRLRKRLGWGKDRDQEWNYYFPLIDQARINGLPLFGIDLPSGIRRRITKLGIENLTPIEQRLVISTGFKNPIYRKIMEQEFVRGHCGWSDPELLNKLYQTRVARNDAMATAISDMLSSITNRPIVIIVGRGHTKYNMGVYERVQSLVAEVQQVNIGFTPVQEDTHVAEEYIHQQKVDQGAVRPTHEFLWFTPSVDLEDPCIKYKALLEKHPQSKTKVVN